MKRIFLAILPLWLSSCVTYEKCLDKYGSGQDSVKVPATITASIKGDTTILNFTVEMLEAMPVNGTLTTDHNGQKASVKKSGTGKFTCEAETLTKTITKTVEVPCPPINNFKPDPEIIYKIPGIIWYLIVALALALLIQTVRVWISKRISGTPVSIFQGYLNPPPPPAKRIIDEVN